MGMDLVQVMVLGQVMGMVEGVEEVGCFWSLVVGLMVVLLEDLKIGVVVVALHDWQE